MTMWVKVERTGRVTQDEHTHFSVGDTDGQVTDTRQGKETENEKELHSLQRKLKAKGKLVFSRL